jgi:hypothetical protein
LKLLLKTLRSTLQAPYSELILVEHNGDGSLYYFVKEWAKEYRVEVDRLETKGPPSSALKALVNHFLSSYSQEWLLLVKGILELRPGWWIEASKYLEGKNTGLVWGIVWTPWELDKGCSENPACVQGKLKKFECLGGLDDALVRREALKDLAIPSYVRNYVDAWIYWWLKCRGWKVEVVKRGAVAPSGLVMGKPASSIYEAYRLGIIEECGFPHREAYKGILRLTASLLAGLASYTITQLTASLLGGRINRISNMSTDIETRLKLVIARLRYGSPRHPCELVFNLRKGFRLEKLTKSY